MLLSPCSRQFQIAGHQLTLRPKRKGVVHQSRTKSKSTSFPPAPLVTLGLVSLSQTYSYTVPYLCAINTQSLVPSLFGGSNVDKGMRRKKKSITVTIRQWCLPKAAEIMRLALLP